MSKSGPEDEDDYWERLWKDYWRETHKPDKNGQYYWDRQKKEND